MKKILLIISLFIGLFSYSQESLLKLEGAIYNAEDSVMCTLYYFNQDSLEWSPIIVKMYKDSYTIDFYIKEELYALEFFNPVTHQSNCLIILTGNKSKQIIDVFFDTDPKMMKDKYGLLFNQKGTKDNYKIATIL